MFCNRHLTLSAINSLLSFSQTWYNLSFWSFIINLTSIHHEISNHRFFLFIPFHLIHSRAAYQFFCKFMGNLCNKAGFTEFIWKFIIECNWKFGELEKFEVWKTRKIKTKFGLSIVNWECPDKNWRMARKNEWLVNWFKRISRKS